MTTMLQGRTLDSARTIAADFDAFVQAPPDTAASAPLTSAISRVRRRPPLPLPPRLRDAGASRAPGRGRVAGLTGTSVDRTR